MYTKCKYVVLSQKIEDDTIENIYIFPSTVIHRTVVKNMKGVCVGAGFIARTNKNKLYCVGSSDSLGIKSRGDKDTELLGKLLS